jgi:hypothetical protein
MLSGVVSPRLICGRLYLKPSYAMWAAEDKYPGTADQNGRFELKNVSTVLIEQQGWFLLTILKRARR